MPYTGKNILLCLHVYHGCDVTYIHCIYLRIYRNDRPPIRRTFSPTLFLISFHLRSRVLSAFVFDPFCTNNEQLIRIWWATMMSFRSLNNVYTQRRCDMVNYRIDRCLYKHGARISKLRVSIFFQVFLPLPRTTQPCTY